MLYEVPNVFTGPPDVCERLIGCLQYASFLPNSPQAVRREEFVAGLVSKGVLYKALLKMDDLASVDQIFYVLQKFSEFGDRLHIVDVEVSISRLTLEDLLSAALARIGRLFEEVLASLSTLRVFVFLKIKSVYCIFHRQREEDGDHMTAIVLSNSATIYQLPLKSSFAQLSVILAELLTSLVNKSDDGDSKGIQGASIMCLLQEFGEEVDLLQGAMAAAQEEESLGNIQAIRRRLSDILMEAKVLAVAPSSPLRVRLVPSVVASPGAPLTRQAQSKLNGPLGVDSQLLLRGGPDARDEATLRNSIMGDEQRFPSQSVLRATTGGLSKSLLADLMSSREEEEDILAYVQRAYKAIQSKTVTKALENMNLSTSVSSSTVAQHKDDNKHYQLITQETRQYQYKEEGNLLGMSMSREIDNLGGAVGLDLTRAGSRPSTARSAVGSSSAWGYMDQTAEKVVGRKDYGAVNDEEREDVGADHKNASMESEGFVRTGQSIAARPPSSSGSTSRPLTAASAGRVDPTASSQHWVENKEEDTYGWQSSPPRGKNVGSAHDGVEDMVEMEMRREGPGSGSSDLRRTADRNVLRPQSAGEGNLLGMSMSREIDNLGGAVGLDLTRAGSRPSTARSAVGSSSAWGYMDQTAEKVVGRKDYGAVNDEEREDVGADHKNASMESEGFVRTGQSIAARPPSSSGSTSRPLTAASAGRVDPTASSQHWVENKEEDTYGWQSSPPRGKNVGSAHDGVEDMVEMEMRREGPGSSRPGSGSSDLRRTADRNVLRPQSAGEGNLLGMSMSREIDNLGGAVGLDLTRAGSRPSTARSAVGSSSAWGYMDQTAEKVVGRKDYGAVNDEEREDVGADHKNASMESEGFVRTGQSIAARPPSSSGSTSRPLTAASAGRVDPTASSQHWVENKEEDTYGWQSSPPRGKNVGSAHDGVEDMVEMEMRREGPGSSRPGSGSSDLRRTADRNVLRPQSAGEGNLLGMSMSREIDNLGGAVGLDLTRAGSRPSTARSAVGSSSAWGYMDQTAEKVVGRKDYGAVNDEEREDVGADHKNASMESEGFVRTGQSIAARPPSSSGSTSRPLTAASAGRVDPTASSQHWVENKEEDTYGWQSSPPRGKNVGSAHDGVEDMVEMEMRREGPGSSRPGSGSSDLRRTADRNVLRPQSAGEGNLLGMSMSREIDNLGGAVGLDLTRAGSRPSTARSAVGSSSAWGYMDQTAEKVVGRKDYGAVNDEEREDVGADHKNASMESEGFVRTGQSIAARPPSSSGSTSRPLTAASAGRVDPTASSQHWVENKEEDTYGWQSSPPRGKNVGSAHDGVEDMVEMEMRREGPGSGSSDLRRTADRNVLRPQSAGEGNLLGMSMSREIDNLGGAVGLDLTRAGSRPSTARSAVGSSSAWGYMDQTAEKVVGRKDYGAVNDEEREDVGADHKNASMESEGFVRTGQSIAARPPSSSGSTSRPLTAASAGRVDPTASSQHWVENKEEDTYGWQSSPPRGKNVGSAHDGVEDMVEMEMRREGPGSGSSDLRRTADRNVLRPQSAGEGNLLGMSMSREIDNLGGAVGLDLTRAGSRPSTARSAVGSSSAWGYMDQTAEKVVGRKDYGAVNDEEREDVGADHKNASMESEGFVRTGQSIAARPPSSSGSTSRPLTAASAGRVDPTASSQHWVENKEEDTYGWQSSPPRGKNVGSAQDGQSTAARPPSSSVRSLSSAGVYRSVDESVVKSAARQSVRGMGGEAAALLDDLLAVSGPVQDSFPPPPNHSGLRMSLSSNQLNASGSIASLGLPPPPAPSFGNSLTRTGTGFNNQSLLDELYCLQDQIEQDALSIVHRRNQYRLRIGKRALQILQQQQGVIPSSASSSLSPVAVPAAVPIAPVQADRPSPQRIASLPASAAVPPNELVVKEKLQTPMAWEITSDNSTASRSRSKSAARIPRSNGNESSTTSARPASRSALRGGEGSRNSKLTNAAQTKNALTHVCLAGSHSADRRREVLDLVDYYTSSASPPRSELRLGTDCVVHPEWQGRVWQFVCLFVQAQALAFRALYVLHPQQPLVLLRIYGRGPDTLQLGEGGTNVKSFLKFETSSKAFKPLPVKTLSATVDAIVLEPGPLKLQRVL
eukprot:gene2764-3017_t